MDPWGQNLEKVRTFVGLTQGLGSFIFASSVAYLHLPYCSLRVVHGFCPVPHNVAWWHGAGAT